MKESTNISVILPVHELDEVTKDLFNNAVKSVENQKTLPSELVVVIPKDSDALTYVKSYDFGELKNIVTIVENDGSTDFASQVNLGVSKAK